MKRLVGRGLLLVAGAVSLPLSVSPRLGPGGPAGSPGDPRLSPIREFFRGSDCPAEGYAEAFLEAADDYELDWRLLPSISFIESTGGKAAHHNNLLGWDGGRARFPTPAAGIHAVAYNLAHAGRYRDKPLDELLAVYSPEAGYADRVKQVMRRIAPSEEIQD